MWSDLQQLAVANNKPVDRNLCQDMTAVTTMTINNKMTKKTVIIFFSKIWLTPFFHFYERIHVFVKELISRYCFHIWLVEPFNTFYVRLFISVIRLTFSQAIVFLATKCEFETDNLQSSFTGSFRSGQSQIFISVKFHTNGLLFFIYKN